MKERFLCIHGHFYQPPRENPWLEAIEIQDSARPYHDWNKRITVECYAPNSASRILNGEQRIVDIVSNYAKISFNFGPTVLSWMEEFAPETYEAILDADRQSKELRSGHGNAIAQAYNHLIMPLANSRDKRTQVIWGIHDFERRFKRFPEGMWLPETAVDLETLDIMAEQGIKFTILAPHQASRVRKIGAGRWKDISGGRIDPSRPYLCRLRSGREITLFFYDGPISHAVAFEGILKRGEDFVNRLLSGFSDARTWTQILHIATDGETYGHHHRFGEMALAYALHDVETKDLACLTNYGEHLEFFPPTHEVEIVENTSWSCFHGIERWRSDCGCNTGGHPVWNQEWRAPLREALDWLREGLAPRYELKAREYLKDPWKARDEYVGVILDRSPEGRVRFFEKHAARILTGEETVATLKLLELQRHALLMYTSCGWFFDELSGIEAVQVIQYAGRAVQLWRELGNEDLEPGFLEILAKAKSNIPEHGDGGSVYEKFVKPSVVDLEKVVAHYGISTLFMEYPENTRIYSYEVSREDYEQKEAGRTRLAMGRVSVLSRITGESRDLSFSVLHLGDHVLNGGVGAFGGPDSYASMKKEIMAAFEKGDFTEILRLMDRHFGTHTYSLKDLFRDEQRRVLRRIISKTLEEFENAYRGLYENNRTLMGFLEEAGVPVPRAFATAAEFILNVDLKRAFWAEHIDEEAVKGIMGAIRRWRVPLNSDIEFSLRRRVEKLMSAVYQDPFNKDLMAEFRSALELLRSIPVDINLWQTQNLYYRMAKTVYQDVLAKTGGDDEEASRWVETFRDVGRLLVFGIDAVPGMSKEQSAEGRG